MTAIIILGLLCLAAASLILRVVLFILGSSDHGRLAKIASIAGSIGFLPVIAFEWASNLAMVCLLILLLAYWIAPQPEGAGPGPAMTNEGR
jgi:hypothetical protein